MHSVALPLGAPISRIVDEHGDQASFLWERRDTAVRAPHYTLQDLTDIDRQIEGHVDGLCVAGKTGRHVCREQLMWGGAGEAFAFTMVLQRSGNESELERELLKLSDDTAVRGVISALAWNPATAAPMVPRLLESSAPTLRRVGLAVMRAGQCPVDSRFPSFLTADDPHTRATALRTVGELGAVDLLERVMAQITDPDWQCRFAAARSGLMLRSEASEGAVSTLAQLVRDGHDLAEQAFALTTRAIPVHQRLTWHRELTAEPAFARYATIAAGASGDPTLVAWLIEQMAKESTARVAGEAVSMITGLDILESKMSVNAQSDETTALEDPADETVTMDRDDRLSWPDAEKVDRWWSAQKKHFEPGVRYLVGQPISGQWCERILRTGYQRQRAAAAVELKLMQRDQPLFNVASPGFVQQQQLELNGGGQRS